MRICKVCRTVNSDSAENCCNCGTSLQNQKAYIKERTSAARQKQHEQYIQNKQKISNSTSSKSVNTRSSVSSNKVIYRNAHPYQDKTVIGVLCALFMGLLGLIIGCLDYPPMSYERQSFTKAFWKTILVEVLVALIVIFAVCCKACSD